MRLDSSNVLNKKNTRNTLTTEQMHKLHELGLIVLSERSNHISSELGVEELMQILPTPIVVDKKMYSLSIYKNVFDVQCVAYYRNGDDWLYGVAVDDIPNVEHIGQSGHLVDALYDCLLWVNETYPNELKEYKDELQQYHQP